MTTMSRRSRSRQMFIEIAAQPLRISLGIRQGDIAVWPDEIERCVREAGVPHVWSPRKAVKRKPQLGADLRQAAAHFAIHVNLPCQRSKRSEVVMPRFHLHPGDAIPAPDFTGRPLAQWTEPIMDADLRQCLEQKVAQRRHSKEQRHEAGRVACERTWRQVPVSLPG